MRRLIAFGLVVLLATASLAIPSARPIFAQDGIELGEAPALANGAVVAASNGEIVSAAVVPTVDTSSRAASASFYYSYYVAQPAIGWTGSQSSCVAGTTSAGFKAAVIDRIAFFRAMAGVPSAVVLSADTSASDQQAALMFSRNSQISHSPSSSWACYTSAGAQAAANSNIALGVYGVDAITAYMKDAGASNAAAGHRRWILYPQTQAFGTGDVPRVDSYPSANALWVWDSNVSGPRPGTRDGFVAWPPPGYIPYQVVFPRWSFSYPGANFGGASVSVTLAGSSVPVTIDSSTATGYGENTIVFRLNGLGDSGIWPNPGTDATYSVRISGVSIGGASRTFSYNVTVFDPSTSAPTTNTPTRTPTASSTPTASPTSTRTPTNQSGTETRTPTTTPGGYAPGSLFKTTTSLSLRAGPGTTFARIAVLPAGAIGQVTGSPVMANGFTFYPVTVSGYGSGWAAGEFFLPLAATATPTGTRTATAAAPSPTSTRTTTSSPLPPTTTPTRVPGTFANGDTVRTTTSVNLRSAPSTGASVVFVVPPNTAGRITGSGVVSGSYTFYPVTITGYGSGWMASSFLALTTAPTPQPTATQTPSAGSWGVGTTVYTTTALNIRSGPGTSYSIRGVAPTGSAATVTGAPVQSGTLTWYPLDVTGIGTGWAAATYLSGAPTVQGPQLRGSSPTSSPVSNQSTAEPTNGATTAPIERSMSGTPTPQETATLAVSSVTPDTQTVVAQSELTESNPPTTTPEQASILSPVESDQQFQTSGGNAETEVSDPAADPQPWLPVERIQRSADSQPGQVLVDEDPTSVWTANGVDQPLAMFVLDLGEPRDFSQVTWLTGASGQSGTLYISVSNDGSTWTDLDPTQAIQGSDGWVTLDAAGSGQYIRFIFVNDSGADWLGGISEVRIMP